MNAILTNHLELISKRYSLTLPYKSPYAYQHLKFGFEQAIKIEMKFHEWLDTNEWAVIDEKDLSYKNLFQYFLKNVFKIAPFGLEYCNAKGGTAT